MAQNILNTPLLDTVVNGHNYGFGRNPNFGVRNGIVRMQLYKARSRGVGLLLRRGHVPQGRVYDVRVMGRNYDQL